MTKEIKFVGGYIPDIEDPRDFPATKLLVRELALPESYTVNENTIIYDQGQTPQCVGYSSAGVKTDQEYSQYGKQIKFDGTWLYNECKKEDGIPNIEGTYPRVACKILQQRGCKTVSGAATCPLRFFKPKPPEPTPEDIAKWKIDAYFRIDPKSTADFVKQIIYQFGSIKTASTWWENWMEKFYVFPSPSGRSVGGHDYRAIGWNTIGFVIANSWGTVLWGKSGIATMPYDVFHGILMEGDCWKLVDHATDETRQQILKALLGR
jgi:hypothetical protein